MLRSPSTPDLIDATVCSICEPSAEMEIALKSGNVIDCPAMLAIVPTTFRIGWIGRDRHAWVEQPLSATVRVTHFVVAGQIERTLRGHVIRPGHGS